MSENIINLFLMQDMDPYFITSDLHGKLEKNASYRVLHVIVDMMITYSWGKLYSQELQRVQRRSQFESFSHFPHSSASDYH